MGSSPCRRIHLLSIVHTVVGKYFQALEVHWGMKHTQDLSCEKGQILALLCFVKFWAKNLVLVYVNEKFCDKNLLLDLFSVVLIVFPNFILPATCV